jgi:hypothetical protein
LLARGLTELLPLAVCRDARVDVTERGVDPQPLPAAPEIFARVPDPAVSVHEPSTDMSAGRRRRASRQCDKEPSERSCFVMRTQRHFPLPFSIHMELTHHDARTTPVGLFRAG